MKGNLALPGGPLTSKPTWVNTFGCLPQSVFLRSVARSRSQQTGTNLMDKSNLTLVPRIARVVPVFQQRTGCVRNPFTTQIKKMGKRIARTG